MIPDMRPMRGKFSSASQVKESIRFDTYLGPKHDSQSSHSCDPWKRGTYIAKQTEACSGGSNNGIEQGVTVKATISNDLARPDYWAFLAARHFVWSWDAIGERMSLELATTTLRIKTNKSKNIKESHRWRRENKSILSALGVYMLTGGKQSIVFELAASSSPHAQIQLNPTFDQTLTSRFSASLPIRPRITQSNQKNFIFAIVDD